MKKFLKYLKYFLVVFVIVVGGFFLYKIKSGGNLAANFVSINYKWGLGDTLQNSYDSKSGEYIFLDQQDKLVKKHFKLRTNNIIFLNSLINKDSLLNLPDTIRNFNSKTIDSVLRFEFVFNYVDKQKHIVFYTDYSENSQILSKAKQLQSIVKQTIDEAESRYLK